MKFSTASTVALTLSSLWGDAIAFAPAAKLHAGAKSSGRRAGARFMAMDMDMPATVQDAPAPATRAAESLPVIQSRGGAPGAVRYSDFLTLVKSDKIEKVTFSADGTQLLGVDTDGTRLKIEALPNDPDLLTELTGHKVSAKRIVSEESNASSQAYSPLLLTRHHISSNSLIFFMVHFLTG